MKLLFLSHAIIAASSFAPSPRIRHLGTNLGVATLDSASPQVAPYHSCWEDSPQVDVATTQKLELLECLTSPQVEEFMDLARKLHLCAFEDDSLSYGFESKDPSFDVKTLKTKIHYDDPTMGMELFQVPNQYLEPFDRRTTVISKVYNHATDEAPIKVGDVIIGVEVGASDMIECTAGMGYGEMVHVLERAKQCAAKKGHSTITLELNRLVKNKESEGPFSQWA